MEKLDREINIQKLLTPTDSNNDGVIDSLVLTTPTININVYLTQTIDDLGVFTDVESEDFEVIDLNGFWDTSNTGVGQGGIPYSPPIFNTALSGITDSTGSLTYNTLTIGCRQPTAINYCSNCTEDCLNCCVESWGGGNTSGELGGTGLNPVTFVLMSDVIIIPSIYNPSPIPIIPGYNTTCESGSGNWGNVFYNTSPLTCLVSDTKYSTNNSSTLYTTQFAINSSTNFGETWLPNNPVYLAANQKCINQGGIKVIDMLPFNNPGYNRTISDGYFKGVSFKDGWQADGLYWHACYRYGLTTENWNCNVNFWCMKQV